MPDLPTVAEADLPNFVHVAWHALYAPANTPPEIVAKLNAEVVKILKDPEVAQRLAEQGTMPSPGTPADLVEFMGAEAQRASQLVARTGIKRE